MLASLSAEKASKDARIASLEAEELAKVRKIDKRIIARYTPPVTP